MAAHEHARLIPDFLLTRGRTHRYGADRSQRGDLHLPPARARTR